MNTIDRQAHGSALVWQHNFSSGISSAGPRVEETTKIATHRSDAGSLTDPANQAYHILHVAFTLAPILFGLDKFFNLMVNWDKYMAPWAVRIVGNEHQFMHLVGIVEILAGLVVAFKPRLGSYIVALWLLAIIVNLLTYPGFYDVALRDFGLLLGALALARLSVRVSPVQS